MRAESATLAALTQEVIALREAVTQLQSVLAMTLLRPPIHLEVQELALERLAFLIPGIEVGSIEGALNIGLTQQVHVGESGTPEAGPWVAGSHPLWPPLGPKGRERNETETGSNGNAGPHGATTPTG